MRIKIIILVALFILITGCVPKESQEFTAAVENTTHGDHLQETTDFPDTIDMHGLDPNLYWLVIEHGSSIEKGYTQEQSVFIDDLMPIFTSFELMDENGIRSSYEKYQVEYGTIRISKQVLMDTYFNKHFAMHIETNGSQFEDTEDPQYWILRYTTRHPWIDILDYSVDDNIYTFQCEYGYIDFDLQNKKEKTRILHNFKLVLSYENAENYKFLSYTIFTP